MASVFKLPLAMTVLNHGRLDDRIKVEASDIRPFRSPIADRAPHGGITLTVSELVEQMLVESDNTAADLLLRLSGGGPGVNSYLRKLGIEGIRVDRSEGEMALDYAGVTDVPPPSHWTLDWFKRAMDAVPRDQQRAAAQRFFADDRDTAIPDAMAALLRSIVQGRALPNKLTDSLLDQMRRTVPAAARIKAGVPAGTPVAHRPGSGGENEGVTLCTNDVGIVTLPGGKHLIIAVFLKGSNKNTATRERAIADVTRAIYHAWN